MRILYHFPMSPFSRRVRLALAYKGLSVELRDARADPAILEEARQRWPLRTMPVFVEEDGRALGDSTAIAHYLDHAYPEAPSLWPSGSDAHAAFEVASLVDGTLNLLIDFGTRLYPLRKDEAWDAVKGEALRRAQGALDALDALAAGMPALGRATIARSGWSAADIWLFTAVKWLGGLPARVETFPPAGQILSLGWKLPDGLSRWADAYNGRPDVRELG